VLSEEEPLRLRPSPVTDQFRSVLEASTGAMRTASAMTETPLPMLLRTTLSVPLLIGTVASNWKCTPP